MIVFLLIMSVCNVLISTFYELSYIYWNRNYQDAQKENNVVNFAQNKKEMIMWMKWERKWKKKICFRMIAKLINLKIWMNCSWAWSIKKTRLKAVCFWKKVIDEKILIRDLLIYKIDYWNPKLFILTKKI